MSIISVFKEWIYKTPAVVYNRDSCTLLVFANAARAVGSQRRLVMRTFMLDICRNFSPTTQIVREASLPGHISMNPCPVFDEKNGKLFLFFMVTNIEHRHEEHLFYKSRLCYITSNNFGHTWNTVNHLTVCLPEHCITLAIGPGHGLQTEDGRLIVPTFALMDENSADDKPVPHAVALYSDDGGESWQLGSLLPENSAECQMAEVWGDEGRFIYCNAINKDRRLVEAFSQDNGNTFVVSEGGKFANTYPGSPGSVLSFPVPDTAAMESGASPSPNKWLLFTQPSISGMELGVYVNKTPPDPKAWTKPWIINIGPSGHSDMVYLGDGYIACVFETEENEDLDNVAMKIFNLWPKTDDTDRCLCSCTVM